MDKTFCCEASRLAWELFKQDKSIGALSLFINLENDLIKVEELVEDFSYDQGPEMEM